MKKSLSLSQGFTWYSALVRLVSSVGSDVLLEVGQLGELPLTDLAPVGLDAQVDPHMLREVGAVGEWFTAVAAFVRFRLSHVDLGVELQVCFWSKALKQKIINISQIFYAWAEHIIRLLERYL